MKDKKTDLVIYETKDYDKFKLLIENRKVRENRNLLASVQERNKLKYNPIIVNARMEVLDGQHRLSVAKKLDVPIYYLIDDESENSDVQALNISTKIWSLHDHVWFFANSGNKDYKYIATICEEFNLPIKVFIESFCSNPSKNKSDCIRKGKTKIKYELEKIYKTLNQLEDIKEKFKMYSGKFIQGRFLIVILQLMLHEDYDHERFLRAIDKYPDSFIKSSKYIEIFYIKSSLLEGVYNKKYSEENRIEL